jgi:hypothetical protein
MGNLIVVLYLCTTCVGFGGCPPLYDLCGFWRLYDLRGFWRLSSPIWLVWVLVVVLPCMTCAGFGGCVPLYDLCGCWRLSSPVCMELLDVEFCSCDEHVHGPHAYCRVYVNQMLLTRIPIKVAYCALVITGSSSHLWTRVMYLYEECESILCFDYSRGVSYAFYIVLLSLGSLLTYVWDMQ